MINNIIIREIFDSDYEQLADFNSNYPGDKRTKIEWIDRYKNWWDDNPAYSKNHPRGVIALSQDKVVGATHNFPTRMLWNGIEIKVINGSSWRVNEEFRKISMDIWHKHREITKDFVLFNSTASPQVEKLLEILKFKKYSIAEKWYYYFGCPTKMNNSNKLTVISLLQKIFIGISPKHKNNLEFREMVEYPYEIGMLWEKHKNDFEYTNKRDKKYINWLSKTKKIIYLYEHNYLVGFFVTHYVRSKNTYILVDYWPKNIQINAKQFIKFFLKKNKDKNFIIPAYSEFFVKSAKSMFMLSREKSTYGFINFGSEVTLNNDKCFFNMLQGDYGM